MPSTISSRMLNSSMSINYFYYYEQPTENEVTFSAQATPSLCTSYYLSFTCISLNSVYKHIAVDSRYTTQSANAVISNLNKRV